LAADFRLHSKGDEPVHVASKVAVLVPLFNAGPAMSEPPRGEIARQIVEHLCGVDFLALPALLLDARLPLFLAPLAGVFCRGNPERGPRYGRR
jgi:hypothetical protein